MKRGQAALEFLMTYGWVILIVIIVIGALAAFGVFDVSRLVPDKCLLPTQLSCRDFGAPDANTVQVELLNTLGRTVVVNTVELWDKDSQASLCNSTSPVTIDNQLSGTVTIGSATDSCGLSAGRKYRLQVIVNYNFQGSTITKDLYGDMTITGPRTP